MSRKTASFSQLLNYINKGREKEDDYFFTHNIYAHTPYNIVKEFLQNHKHLKKRKNTNSLFHEVISIKYQQGYTKEELKEILKDLTEQYIKARANNCLVYAVIHEQHNQIHSHLMISSNEIENIKTHYFSKHQYKQIQDLTRKYAYEKYPRLEREETKEKLKEQSRQSSKRKSKTVDSEIHLKKRTGLQTDKEKLRARLKTIFELAKNQDELLKYLRLEKLELYQRGQTFGILDQDTNKKYRIKTLDLENEFETMNNSFLQQAREQSKHYEQSKNNSQNHTNDFTK